MRQPAYIMFITNKCASCHFWRKENLLKRQKGSAYYKNVCLQKCLLLFMSLLAAPIVKRGHIGLEFTLTF